ncbi:DUF4436 domain-containing protein [Mycobacterium paraseoulense]|uniref:DUF4436 domain-containing protein n=1 Tax=Mycobacterium paraseoulense TaxID=590652 RepID=A0A1X0I436_9MYCO|nr:DUF4436 domain-containing protein [Mycobacterium paraseoulense]MCV7394736.1 DUF4436 domain-containing protein [Mycobacterium paraseoulense]ORB33986.1 DUF4436 domain-containing protein [Mycobacterium paraseoulense]BBZ73665.1 DUF4436 domain-containing protein [Mycobacterium paraseoulense]
MRSAVQRFAAVGFIVLIAGTYVALIGLYQNTVEGSSAGTLSDNAETASQSMATLTVEEMQSNYSAVVANVAVAPGPALLDPVTHRLKEDLMLRVRSSAQPSRRDYTKGMLPGVFPLPLTIAGHVERWPFDNYTSGPIEVQLFHGADTTKPPELIPVRLIDHLPGFKVSATKIAGHEGYRLSVRRALSTAVFGIVICGVLIAIAGLGLFVAIQTMRDRRKFQPPMTTWYAAMLFAVVPLRNALPGSPPFGAWIDVTIVLWVIVALVIAMLLYIVCWWRHLRPEVVAPPADPVPAPSG